jgi:general secretion pathway protein K
MFMRLLLVCDPNMDNQRAQRITNSVHFTVRYVSFTEIRRFMSAEEFSRLAPHIIALPEKTPLNINHIDPRVLAAAIPQLTAAQAEQFVQEHRTTQNFKDLSQAMQQPLLAQRNVTLDSERFTVNSSYYLLRSHVQQANVNTFVTSLYQVRKKGGRQTLLLLWRRL